MAFPRARRIEKDPIEDFRLMKAPPSAVVPGHFHVLVEPRARNVIFEHGAKSRAATIRELVRDETSTFDEGFCQDQRLSTGRRAHIENFIARFYFERHRRKDRGRIHHIRVEESARSCFDFRFLARLENERRTPCELVDLSVGKRRKIERGEAIQSRDLMDGREKRLAKPMPPLPKRGGHARFESYRSLTTHFLLSIRPKKRRGFR